MILKNVCGVDLEMHHFHRLEKLLHPKTQRYCDNYLYQLPEFNPKLVPVT